MIILMLLFIAFLIVVLLIANAVSFFMWLVLIGLGVALLYKAAKRSADKDYKV